MSEATRLRVYAAGWIATVALCPLAMWAAVVGERKGPPLEIAHAMDELRIMLAAGALPGSLPSRTLEDVPGDPALAWLAPVIRAEILGESLPRASHRQGEPPGVEIADLFRTPPPPPEDIPAIVAVVDARVPYPFLRLRLRARAADIAGDARARADRERAAEMARVVLARVTVASAYFLLMFVSGLVFLAYVAMSPPRQAPLPEIAAADGWGLFATWMGSHLLAVGVASTLAAPSSWHLPLMAFLYLTIGAAVLWLSGPFVATRLQITRRALLGLQGRAVAIAWGVAALAVAIPLVTGAYVLSAELLGLEGTTQSSVLTLLVSGSWTVKVGILLLVSAGAPIVEEGIFRGLLLPAMVRHMAAPAAIALNGILFGLVHFDPPVLLPLCALGCVLAWLRVRTGSLVPSMVAHGLWNLQTVALVTLLFGPVHVP